SALGAMQAVDLTGLPPVVARDLGDAIARLRGRTDSRPAARAGVPTPGRGWSGRSRASALELRFHDDMLAIFRRAGEATRHRRPDGSFARGYWATYFLRGVRNHGGLAYAHQLLAMEGTTPGFERLRDEGFLDLTMEALVLQPEYEPLFSVKERQIASSRLA